MANGQTVTLRFLDVSLESFTFRFCAICKYQINDDSEYRDGNQFHG